MNTLTTLLGGREEELQFRDGRCERVLIREVPVAELPAWFAAQEEEGRLVEIYCGKDADWVGSLTRASVAKVLRVGQELNLDFFSEITQLRIARANVLTPLLNAGISAATLPGSPSS